MYRPSHPGYQARRPSLRYVGLHGWVLLDLPGPRLAAGARNAGAAMPERQVCGPGGWLAPA